MKKLLLNLLVFMAKDLSVLQVSHALGLDIVLIEWDAGVNRSCFLCPPCAL